MQPGFEKVAQILNAETALLEVCNWDEDRCVLILEEAINSIVSICKNHRDEISSKEAFEKKLLLEISQEIDVGDDEFSALLVWIESGLIFRMSQDDIKEILEEGISSIYETNENEQKAN